jgi:pyruvate carboxylase
LQRQRQKLIEIALAFDLAEDMHAETVQAAVPLASEAAYCGVGTIEFLVADDRFVFMEANARLQVEHTVTEEVTGFDLVALQLHIADRASLVELGLQQWPSKTFLRGKHATIKIGCERLRLVTRAERWDHLRSRRRHRSSRHPQMDCDGA